MPTVISITVRRAQLQDAECVSACLEAAFEPFRCHYTIGAFADTVLSPGAVRERMQRMLVYVATTSGGEVVATIASKVEGQEGHIRGMVVLPAWQGRSVAENLLRTVERDLATAGCTRLTLDTTIPLQRAVRFYEKNGFISTGRVTDFFGMPLHEYAKPLSPHRASH